MQIVGKPTEEQRKAADINIEAIDSLVGDWLSENDVVLWQDETIMATGYVEKNFFAVDKDNETVRLLRSWVPFGDWNEARGEDPSPKAVISVDLDKTFEQISCSPDEIDEMSFHLGEGHQLDEPGARLEEAFRKQIGGDIRMLWKSSQPGSASFIGRIARVGQEEALFGGSIRGNGKELQARIDFETPMSDLAPTQINQYRR